MTGKNQAPTYWDIAFEGPGFGTGSQWWTRYLKAVFFTSTTGKSYLISLASHLTVTVPLELLIPAVLNVTKSSLVIT
jgi:hypothetical protein